MKTKDQEVQIFMGKVIRLHLELVMKWLCCTVVKFGGSWPDGNMCCIKSYSGEVASASERKLLIFNLFNIIKN